ncbi:hypothetical protein TrRE_jg2259 [Triparma retinervis]|uniref:SCD domain-containing protein n=1 Tax=Triparma retinervis TaxID=2557542 RepID=A0A9W6Z7G2_9STRA|nr:hypothetical protein TrRE_jg2259 [Triparma retinervis]
MILTMTKISLTLTLKIMTTRTSSKGSKRSRKQNLNTTIVASSKTSTATLVQKNEKYKLEDIDDDEWASMITNVVADMQKATTSQVLVTARRAATKVNAKFLDSFKNFWFSVADAALSEGSGASKKSGSGAPTSARLDVELVKDLILRVTELVGVGQPDIRFASSLAAFEMSRAVLTKIVSLSNNLAIAERQLKAATGARQGSLKTQVESLKRVIAEMEELVTGPVYSVVFMHRYRDSNEFIRTLCMENLSTSIVLRPSLFLQDKYLKYFGWMLSDSSAEVRRAALVALNLPFDTLKQRIENGSDDGSIDLSDMSNVCMKFLDRIAGCSLDANVDVQPHAMALLLSLLREGFLDEVENEKFWDQANFCAINPKATEEMRATSLQFVIEQIEAFDDDEEELAAQGINSGDEERAIVAKVDALASWIASSITGPDTAVEKARVRLTDLVVESLRSIPDQAGIATNWSAILRAINEDAVATTKDNATADTKVDEVKQLVLMRFLLAAVKCEVGDIGDAEFLTGTISKKGKITKKGTGVAHENLSVEMLKALPELFVKFSGDSRMLTQLASLPRYLIHSVFSLPQRKKEFLSLLKQTGDLYLKSTDETVLMQCAMSLTHMTEGGHTRVTDAQNQVQKIIDGLNKKISDLVARKLSTTKKKKKGEVDQDSEFALGLALTQLRILAKRGDVAGMIGDDEIEDFIATLSECAESRIKGAKGSNQTLAESSVVVKEIMAINTVFLGLVDLCYEAFELKADGADWEQDKDSEFMQFLTVTQRAACGTVSDLRSICAKGLKNAANKTLRAVALVDDSRLLNCLAKYIKSLDKSDSSFTQEGLLAISRILIANWDVVNRREAGIVLSNITGASGEATKMISAFMKVAKAKDGVKLLEAHMASLRQSFEEWQAAQPDELGEKFTDDEMDEFTEKEEQHEVMYNGLRTQASKLSGSLGVGKLSNPKMMPAMVGFVKEGIRYAFSCPKKAGGEDDEEQFGDRLSFLGPLKTYLNWIKKNQMQKNEIIADYEVKEMVFKNHIFYNEEVHAEVLKAFGDDFIGILVNRKRAASQMTSDASMPPPAPASSKGSSALDSVVEEGAEYEKGMFDDVEGGKDKRGEGEGSASKRRRTSRGEGTQ